MSPDEIVEATFHRVHRHHIWTTDQKVWKQPEYWISYADEVERGEIFYGDCEDFAMTVVDLCLRQGIPPEECSLATCWDETGEYHGVGIVRDKLIDNRQRRLRNWAAPAYRWDRSMLMSEKGTWRKAA